MLAASQKVIQAELVLDDVIGGQLGQVKVAVSLLPLSDQYKKEVIA